MSTYYVPGLGEKDPDKTIRSLMQAHEKTAANEADIAALQAAIAGPPWGTVTSVATAGLATGGPITTTGTVTVTAATQADQETATSNAVAVTPGQQQSHPSACKAWVAFNSSGTILGSYNIASVSRTATGKFTVTFTVAFSSTNYQCNVTSEVQGASTDACVALVDSTAIPKTTSTVSLLFLNAAASAFVNPTVGHLSCFGDQ